ncbi:MAG: glutamyl-tRNA reductase [Chlorobi bacterium]|nr:glutamyl-tRNA reductase [Chlorobiota bacterium]
MTIYAVGINHHTAPVEIRERFALSDDEISTALRTLHDGILKEAFILSTCNRTELYGVPHDDVETDGYVLQDFLRNLKPEIKVEDRYFFKYFTCGAASHLFNVAASIDSQVLGDVQILKQIKDAYELSLKEGASDTILNTLLHYALRVGKRVRAETSLGIGAISISYAAVQLAGRIFDNLEQKRTLLIGMGETGLLTARHFADRGVRKFMFTNRTRKRAEEIAPKFGAEVVDFSAFPDALREADVVVTATSSPDILITKAMIKSCMKGRYNRPLLVLDISVPRNVDPGAGSVGNVFLNDIDALQGIVDHNISKRKEELPKAGAIVTEELVRFFVWYNSLEATPTIQKIREKFERVRQNELERFRHRIDEKSFEAVELLTHRILQKILHPTMRSLRTQTHDVTSLNMTVQVLREVFDLNDEAPDTDDHHADEPSPGKDNDQ